MKHFEFNYLKKFSCIGSSCKHNCCMGWEIKIDKRSLNKYKHLKGLDDRFDDNAFNGNIFNLKNTRCPFLDSDNLCHIIKNYGEKGLCTTCKTHPRFKSFFTGITETGLGLYCENACKIILTNKTKMRPILVKNDKKDKPLTKFEKQIFAFRKKAVAICQNRKLPIKQRLELLSELANIDLDKMTYTKWIDTYLGLEKLEINDYSFENLKQTNEFNKVQDGFELEFENLLSYLCYRHLSRAIDKLDLRIRLAFVILSFKMINQMFSLQSKKDLSSLIESARFYSSEIETNDENIFSLLDHIESLISYF